MQISHTPESQFEHHSLSPDWGNQRMKKGYTHRQICWALCEHVRHQLIMKQPGTLVLLLSTTQGEGLANLSRRSLQGSSVRLQSSRIRKLQLVFYTHWWIIPKYRHLDQGKALSFPEPQPGKTAIPMVLRLWSP